MEEQTFKVGTDRPVRIEKGVCIGSGATACTGNITNAERLESKASEKMQGSVFPRCQGKSVASKCEAGGTGIRRIKQSRSGGYFMRTWQDLHPVQGHLTSCCVEQRSKWAR